MRPWTGLERRAVEARDLAGAHFRTFDFVMVAFVVVLLLSNVVGAEKRSVVHLPLIGLWPFGAGILFFPISYVIDDVLTEVTVTPGRGARSGPGSPHFCSWR